MKINRTAKLHQFIVLSILVTVISHSNRLNAQVPAYLDTNLTIDARIEDLMSRMTLEEKIGQMTQVDNLALSNPENIKTYFLGSVLSGGGSDPAPENTIQQWTNLYDTFQAKALETRLGIPIIYGIDAVHGHNNVVGTTIFPHNIGLGATRNPDLVEAAARITAIEISATGIDWTFAPCVAVPRDEHWGRTYEGFSENPELVALLGAAAVRGFQSDSLNTPTSIVACAKHYVGDGGTTGGNDQGNTELTEAELRAIHLPGYIAAIDSDVKTIMASYNSWNGQKLHGHSYLLNNVLKGELGFDGFIVSDWAAIDQLPGAYSSDVETSINAGIDMVMVPNNFVEFFTALKSLVNDNKVAMARIDDAVRRILQVKFELGLFENPMADRSLFPLIGSPEHRAVARQCVRESLVLLRKNDNILPLPKDNVKVLVAGEHANNLGYQCGGWTIQWQGGSGNITQGTTILEGLQKIAPGAEIIFDEDGDFSDDNADFAIVVIGEKPYAEGGGDTDNLNVARSQVRLVRKIKKMGIPVITLLISGRPMIVSPILHNSDAFFAAWLPGTEGDGIAEVLFGDFEPSGKSAYSWPKSNDDIPINWGDSDYNPLFPYGFGITSFTNSQTGSAPLLQSVLLAEDGKTLELSFNKPMSWSENSQAVFNIEKNNSDQMTVDSIAISDLTDNVILVYLGECIDQNSTLMISYISGNLTSKDNGVLNVFNAEDVIILSEYISALCTIPGKIEAEDFADMDGIQTENTTDIGGGLNVGWIDDNDWLEYECNVERDGAYSADFRVASQTSGGTLKFLVGGVEKFTITIPVTGGWQSWTTISASLDLERGLTTIRLVAQNGGFNINWQEFTWIASAVTNPVLAQKFQLYQNYPNPFNSKTQIEYNLLKNLDVNLNVYDLKGNFVTNLASGFQIAGTHSVQWNASDVAAGIYLYRMESGQSQQVKRMLFLK